jgi:hypothetical protein
MRLLTIISAILNADSDGTIAVTSSLGQSEVDKWLGELELDSEDLAK